MNGFEDHFSDRAGTYVRYRPTYPPELYSYLASHAPHRRLAWDCGTGNGQAALGLAAHFNRVVATDASAEQISHAASHVRVEYRVAAAEEAVLDPQSTALVTVAVAAHWFSFDRFYAEVRRVLSPRGLIAVWCYWLPAIEPRIDGILDHYLRDILRGYWPDRFRYILEKYETLPFPFEELPTPRFGMLSMGALDDVLGFLHSWSGTAGFQKQRGFNPIDLIYPQLKEAWGAEDRRRELRWDLFLRVGRV